MAPRHVGIVALAALVTTCGSGPKVARYGYAVVNTYPHDAFAYTQGLVFANDVLYESTGQYGSSRVRLVEPETGEVKLEKKLPETIFGEGLALVGDELYQLTWKAGTVNVFEADTLKLKRNYRYDTEGWGLAYDGEELVMSDGSDVLTFRDPETFEAKRSLRVKLPDGRRITDVNELEWVEGEIWANVWKLDQIARIDPETGTITGVIDLTGILPSGPSRGEDAVLNGIAYDPATKRIFVTGKLWPKLFVIEVVPE